MAQDMSKTRIFIWGSCVSRDTFEHFIPEEFDLIQYVARQSALSAYTRPVTLLRPPVLKSEFQQRMVSGDFDSNLRALLAEAGNDVDLLLIDLVDERLGVYILPDGSVVTRSVEFIQSGAEQQLPVGTRHVAFGTPQHFEYWQAAITTVASLIRDVMPRAAVALLDIPWAERSESGALSPNSFGITAGDANGTFPTYVDAAQAALTDALVIRIDPQLVASSPTHPWGEAPFHYSERVYLDIVKQLTGLSGRTVWTSATQASTAPDGMSTTTIARTSIRAGADAVPDPDLSAQQSSTPATKGPSAANAASGASTAAPSPEERLRANQLAAISLGLRGALPGTWKRQWVWRQSASVHEFEAHGTVYAFDIVVQNDTVDIQILTRDASKSKHLKTSLDLAGVVLGNPPKNTSKHRLLTTRVQNGVVSDKLIKRLAKTLMTARNAIEQSIH